MPNSPSPSKARPVIIGPILAGLIAGVLAAYSGSVEAPFVYDDILAIPRNTTIRELWPLAPVLLPQAEGGLTTSGRPVLNLSLALNHAISGTEVWSYHVFNILLHVGSVVVLFDVVRKTLARLGSVSEVRSPTRSIRDGLLRPNPPSPGTAVTDPAMLAGAVCFLWGLHPLLTQAITYTIQRAESLMGFFYLLALLGFVRGATGDRDEASRRKSALWLAVSVVACAMGMGTKEVMATAPLVIFLYDRTFIAGTFAAAWRARWRYYLLLSATWILLAALVVSTGGNRGGTVGLGTGVPLWAYPLTQFQAVARYLLLTCWPEPLVFEYGTLWALRAGDVVPYALLVLPLIVGTVIALQRRPVLGFLGAWFFLILAPTSLAPGTIQMIVEHRMYLPLIAVVALVVWSANRWLGRAAIPLFLIAAIALGFLTYRRNLDYLTPLRLWQDTVAKRPANPRAHDAVAEALENIGRNADALLHRREAVRLLPSEATYHYNLASALASAQQTDEAIHHYRQAIKLAPQHAYAHNNLAILLGSRGDNIAATTHYATAVGLKPSDLFHYNFGIALLRAHRHLEAVEQFEAALKLGANHTDARFNLATALMQLNRVPEAIEQYATALKLRPDDAEFRVGLGNALLLANRPEEALGHFKQVLSKRPEAIEASYGAGNAHSLMRQFDSAVGHYLTTLQYAPNHANAHIKLANAFLNLDRTSDAIAHYQKALELAPTDAEGHHNLGVAFARSEKWREAEQQFETALRLKPDYVDARQNLDRIRPLLRR